ncbi:uncharacterized protein LOC101892036 [Musca domestica]|uniref:Uncharacterized protein LOC101892036 n=1 Tax=Musca domestica TaxID=7370 RepID=A0A1I8MC14_MUSDO|nr:uncharacterized protein LOC101892036 [Musca domestica]
MDRSLFAIIIAIISCIAYIAVGGLTIGDLLFLIEHQKEVNSYGTVLALMCVSLVFYLAMFLISLIMLVGVKKRRPELIGPWVVLGAIGIICSILNFFVTGIRQPTMELMASLIYIALSCLVWYPIYKLWHDMRNGSFPLSREQQEYQPPPGYYAPPPVSPTTEENQNERVVEAPQKE